MFRPILAVSALSCLALSGCGDTVGKQSVYGAAGGALIADAMGGDWRLGALVGSAANVLYCDQRSNPCN